MSRRVRVPAPFQRLLPSVIRNIGPRLVIAAAGCALLLFISGSTYLSHLGQTPTTPLPTTSRAKPANSEVLGASTDTVNTAHIDSTSGNTSHAAAPPAANSTPACGDDCNNPAPTPAPDVPSFDLTVDSSAIQRTLTGLSVPFTVTRHGDLHTPIVLTKVSVTAGGSLTDLITVQTAKMLDTDHGTLTLLTVGLFPHDIQINLAAHSGSAKATTSFSYHIGL